MRDWKVENLTNGQEISNVPFGKEKEDYLCGQYTSFEQSFQKIKVLTIKENNPEILVESEMEQKFFGKCDQIAEYLQRQTSFFSIWNGTAEISLPFHKLSNFQSFISQIVSAILFGWFPDFGETLAIIHGLSQLYYSNKQ